MKHDWKRELATIMCDPVLHDEGVEACRNACVGGASIAAAAITMAAYCENPFTGLPALRECLKRLGALPLDLGVWCAELGKRHPDVAHEADFPPGFGYVGARQARHLRAASLRMAAHCQREPPAQRTKFYVQHRQALNNVLGPLNLAGLSALAFVDHGVAVEEAERCFLLWRMSPALKEAQLARKVGVGRFPFASERFEYEGTWPEQRRLDLVALEKEIGLD
jgi:hypothetical protein